MKTAQQIRKEVLKIARRLEKTELHKTGAKRSIDERITRGRNNDAWLSRMRSAKEYLDKASMELDSLIEDYAVEEARRLVERLVVDLRSTTKPLS